MLTRRGEQGAHLNGDPNVYLTVVVGFRGTAPGSRRALLHRGMTAC